MVYVLIALFIVVPMLELAAFVQVSDWLGFLPALALIVVFSVSGAWLVKYEGIGVWRRAQAQLDRGEIPTIELVNGLLILVAGALMLVPGFLTDILGLLLLIPPTRALVRLVLLRRFAKRLQEAFASPAGAGFGAPFAGGFASTRVFTGTASYGDVPVTGSIPGSAGPGPVVRAGVVDVHEVDGPNRDVRGVSDQGVGGPAVDASGATTSPPGGAPAPESGRY